MGNQLTLGDGSSIIFRLYIYVIFFWIETCIDKVLLHCGNRFRLHLISKRIAMEISTILTADILDIIFEGKNKSYGAYELRKTYRRRLTIAITVMLSLVLLLIAGYLLAKNKKEYNATTVVLPPDTKLENVKPPKEEVLPPPPPKQLDPPKQLETKIFTKPIIAQEVPEDERPPEIKELEDVKIGTANIKGDKDIGLTPPPVDDAAGKGIVEAPPKKLDEWGDRFLPVEIEAMYPGGTPAWQRFLNKNLSNNYPQEAIDNVIQGTVVIQFIVDTVGYVSNVEAISGPDELKDAAVRVIQKSGKWDPAIQNHRKVKSYKRQPIVFKLLD